MDIDGWFGESAQRDDAVAAVARAFACADRPSAAVGSAAWACEGLAPTSQDKAVARAAMRIYALEAGAAALACSHPAAGMRWAWSAGARARGWADALGLGPRVQLALARIAEPGVAVWTKVGVAEHGVHRSAYPLIDADAEDFAPQSAELAAWCAALAASAGDAGAQLGARALLELREALEEFDRAHGAQPSDRARAVRVAAAILGKLGQEAAAGARRAYRSEVAAHALPFGEALVT